MAGQSLQSILSYVTLTKAIQQTTSGIPSRLPEAFMKVTEKCLGNSGRYVQYTGERRTMRLGKYGGASRAADLRDVYERDIKLLHVIESQNLKPQVFKYLRSPDSYEVDKGLFELKRQIREHAAKMKNTKIATIAQVLRTGMLYWDSDGNLLPTSSGASESHNFRVNANNQNQLNGIITASWALNTTDIPLQLRNLKKRAARLTGYPLKYVFYGENVPSYLTQNDYVLDYLSRNPRWSEKYLESAHGEVPDGLFGLTWVPVYEMFYEDSAGTNQDLWSADAVVFTPEVSDEWWGMMEGSNEVPRSLNVARDAMGAFSDVETVYGEFMYAFPTLDPVSITSIVGATWAPLLKNVDVVFQGDCTP